MLPVAADSSNSSVSRDTACWPRAAADAKKSSSTTELSERERELLRYLAVNAGRPVPREELLARVWGISARGVETRTVDMHVARLRDKLCDNTDPPSIIVTVRGKGYRWGG